MGPLSLIVGKTLLIAETATNHVVLSGPPEHVAFIESLIEELDQRPPQIYLSCVIGQLSQRTTPIWNGPPLDRQDRSI